MKTFETLNITYTGNGSEKQVKWAKDIIAQVVKTTNDIIKEESEFACRIDKKIESEDFKKKPDSEALIKMHQQYREEISLIITDWKQKVNRAASADAWKLIDQRLYVQDEAEALSGHFLRLKQSLAKKYSEQAKKDSKQAK